jgi:hypothetical protein
MSSPRKAKKGKKQVVEDDKDDDTPLFSAAVSKAPNSSQLECVNLWPEDLRLKVDEDLEPEQMDDEVNKRYNRVMNYFPRSETKLSPEDIEYRRRQFNILTGYEFGARDGWWDELKKKKRQRPR